MALRHGLGITGNNQGVVTSADHKLDQLGMVVKTGTGNQIRQGIFYNGDPNIVVGTTGMNYSVKPFTAVLSRGASAGAIFITNDGTVTLPTTAADSSNPRIDTIYVWQREYILDGQDSEPVLGVIRGTPNAIPQAPLDSALPAGAHRLADFTVPAGATNTNAGVATQRAPLTAMHGGLVPLRNQTEQDAAQVATGTQVIRLDTRATMVRTETGWDGARVSFTPQWTGFTPGSSTVTGWYSVANSTCFGEVFIALGNGWNMTESGTTSFAPPVTPYQPTDGRPVGQAAYGDTSAAMYYEGVLNQGSNGHLRLFAIGAGDPYGTLRQVRNSVPFAWTAAGSIDVLRLSFNYPI